MRLYFDDTIRYVFDHPFGVDVWNSGSGITDIYFPGADTVGLQSFKKVPYATVLSVRHEWRPHTVLTMRT